MTILYDKYTLINSAMRAEQNYMGYITANCVGEYQSIIQLKDIIIKVLLSQSKSKSKLQVQVKSQKSKGLEVTLFCCATKTN